MADGELLGPLPRRLRAMLYLLTPNESTFERLEDVPAYVHQANPLFLGLVVLEMLLGSLMSEEKLYNVADAVVSVSLGMISRLPLLLTRGLELSAYVYVWENFRLLELPWDSAWTWWLSFLAVDFCYYWFHRFAHEVAILWAAHQVHHSSEYYNFSTALRQPLTQQLTSWIFYVPMALAVPPSAFAVHIQLNLLFQFWLHTEVIRDLGPLEWIFNTPKHHRVHHGTFSGEKEKVVYGLVFPGNSFEIMSSQFHYYLSLWRRSTTYSSLGDKVSTFVNGPSWIPGTPRLGNHDHVPEVTGKEKPHDPSCSLPLQVYVVTHFLLVLCTYHELFENQATLTQLTLLGMTGYVLLTLTSLGFIIDSRPAASILELLRCMVMVVLLRYNHLRPPNSSLTVPTQPRIFQQKSSAGSVITLINISGRMEGAGGAVNLFATPPETHLSSPRNPLELRRKGQLRLLSLSCENTNKGVIFTNL
ncbi:alkylglycerol monooxygenase isoform X1 [Syngnathoides biaculeatus]|uniref:alkylglycerol monooxygenase isoform X1 n=1 Tax=Syngnathoides biaculeatus TaxID=300417 RepID=UPI002ADDC814|nr:alkylglycerol monooxygenase isoform X1 [Syngnathoides biaculeatus]